MARAGNAAGKGEVGEAENAGEGKAGWPRAGRTLAVRNCGLLVRKISEKRGEWPWPLRHKWPKSPEQRGRLHRHRANKGCPAYRENGDLFPSRGEKTLPIPLQRVVKQRGSGCCCGEPADTALSRRWPGSRSIAAARRVRRHRVSVHEGPWSGQGQRGSAGTCPTEGRAVPKPWCPSRQAHPKKTLVPGLDTTSTGTSNITVGVSPSASFLSRFSTTD